MLPLTEKMKWNRAQSNEGQTTGAIVKQSDKGLSLYN